MGILLPDSTRFDPIVKLLPRETVLMSTEDNSGTFVNFEGKDSNERRLMWSKIPSQIVYSDHIVFSLLKDVGIEIHSLLDGSLQKVRNSSSFNISYIFDYINNNIIL